MKAIKKTVSQRIAAAKSLKALNAGVKSVGMEFRKPNNFEYAINEYGEKTKYVLDCGQFQSNRKFLSLDDAKIFAEKFLLQGDF